MKTRFTTLLAAAALLAAPATQAQNQIEFIDINQVKAPVGHDNLLFWNRTRSIDTIPLLHYEVPKGSGIISIFNSNLWLGGEDNNGTLFLSSETYRQTNDRSNWFGPIASKNSSSFFDTTFKAKYERVWKIDKAQIDRHKSLYKLSMYQMPEVIRNWPAHGNTANGEAANLAPFADTNNNGVYDPHNGDYPLISGDQAIYFISNDVTNLKKPFSPPMGLEIHGMVYGFSAATDPALDHTVFLSYRLINRSSTTYQNVYAGIWTDFDIGNYTDDYIGCDVGRNAYFGYNGDAVDEDYIDTVRNGSGSIITIDYKGYGALPPAQGVVFLNQQMNSFLYYENDFTYTGNPEFAAHFYRYLQAQWKDGLPLTFGGNARGGTLPNRYMYPGSSDPSGRGFLSPQAPAYAWSEENADGAGTKNTPEDRRGVGSTGPYTLAPGQELKLDVAYVWARSTSAQDSVSKGALAAAIDHVQNFYNTNKIGSKITGLQQERRQLALQLFPNPAATQATVLFTSPRHESYTIEVLDLTGRLVQVEKTSVDSGTASHTLQLQHLPQGMYLVRVQSETQTGTIRLIRQ